MVLQPLHGPLGTSSSTSSNMHRSESRLEGCRWKEDPRSGFVFRYPQDFTRDGNRSALVAERFADEPHPSLAVQLRSAGLQPAGSLSFGGGVGSSTIALVPTERDYTFAYLYLLTASLELFSQGLDLGVGRAAQITGFEVTVEQPPSGGALDFLLKDGMSDVLPKTVSLPNGARYYSDFAFQKNLTAGNRLYICLGSSIYAAESIQNARIIYRRL